MSTRAWIGLIVAVALGLGGWWALENLTIAEVRFPGRPKPEVLRNPFFVAEKLMRQGGAEVESRFGHRGVPEGAARNAVLFLPIERRTLAASQVDDLLDWVRAGGHLVVVASAPDRSRDAPQSSAPAVEGEAASPRTDRVLAAVGVTPQALRMKRPYKAAATGGQTPTGEPARDDEEAAEREDTDDVSPGDAFPFLLPPQAGDRKDCMAHSEGGSSAPRFPAQWMRLCLPLHLRLESATTPLWSAQAGGDDHIVTHALGQGRVTVLTTARPFQNGSIDRGDHADLLATLLGGSFRNLRITIVVRDDVDNLAVLAWRNAPGVVIALTLLVLAWLGASAVRMGPVTAPLEPVRRSLLEHVHALGEYLWRERAPQVLWAAAEARTRQVIARKVPRFANDTLLAAHLSRRTGLAQPDVLFALNPGDVSHPHDFVRAIATLEHLRKSL